MTLSDRKQSLLFLVLATAAAAREPDLSDYLAGFPIPESAAIIVDATAVSTGVQAGAVIAPSENVVEDNVSRGAAMARALLNRLGDR